MASCGRLARIYMSNDNDVDMKGYIPKMCDIDWSRSNAEWVGRVIRQDGKILSSDEAITLSKPRTFTFATFLTSSGLKSFFAKLLPFNEAITSSSFL